MNIHFKLLRNHMYSIWNTVHNSLIKEIAMIQNYNVIPNKCNTD